MNRRSHHSYRMRLSTCPCASSCGLHGRTVSCDGVLDGRPMLVGEAPGLDEDAIGLPFVGMAGTELDRYLRSVSMVRTVFSINNLVKCRPPDNRDPHALEITTCTENYLFFELVLSRPRVIGALGRLAASWFLGPIDMEHVHGIPVSWDALGWEAIVVPCYHPAAGLHNPNLMLHIVSDFNALAAVIHHKLEPRPPAHSAGDYGLLTGDQVAEVLE